MSEEKWGGGNDCGLKAARTPLAKKRVHAAQPPRQTSELQHHQDFTIADDLNTGTAESNHTPQCLSGSEAHDVMQQDVLNRVKRLTMT